MEFIEYGLRKIGGFLYFTYYLNGRATAVSFVISTILVLAVFVVELAYVGYGDS